MKDEQGLPDRRIFSTPTNPLKDLQHCRAESDRLQHVSTDIRRRGSTLSRRLWDVYRASERLCPNESAADAVPIAPD